MLEIVSQDSLTTAVRESIGVERNKRAACDCKESECDPNGQKQPKFRPLCRPRISLRERQDVDDAPEQHRLGKQRQRKRHIGKRQEHTQAAVWSKLLEHTGVKTEKVHLVASVCPT